MITENKTKKPRCKNRLNKLTYGLIYPAFFGNMIYDIIQMKFGDLKHDGIPFKDIDILIGFLIIIFYAVDYMHLHADMNKLVKLKDRSLGYILCDIFTSVLFFISFVALRLGSYKWSITLLLAVPFCFLFYKRENKVDFRFYGVYSVISALGGGILLILSEFSEKWFEADNKIYYFIYVLILLLFYSYYFFYLYYPKAYLIDVKTYHRKKKKRQTKLS